MGENGWDGRRERRGKGGGREESGIYGEIWEIGGWEKDFENMNFPIITLYNMYLTM